MIDLSCLSQRSPAATDELFLDGAFDATAALLMFAIALAALAAPVVRRAYRQRVTRLMRLNQILPRPPGWWASAAGTGTPRGCCESPRPDADGLAVLAQRAENRITRATVAAWLAFVLAALPVAGWVEAGTGTWGRLTFAAAAALLAVGPALTNLPPRWTRGALAIGFVGCVMGLLLMGSLGEDGSFLSGTGSDDDDLPAWQLVLLALGVGSAYLVMFHRRLRGHVLPSFVVLAVTLLFAMLASDVVQSHAGTCLEEGAPLHIALPVLQATPILLGLWLGLRTLGVLVQLVERGWLSELSLNSAIGLMVIALALVCAQIPDADDGRSAWLAWVPLAWGAVPLGVYALALGRRAGRAGGPQLLVLRVFNQDRRTHTLLDRIQSRWRYVGAVHEIGGPDMVAMNIDPYEGAMFLSGHLHDLFLPEAASSAHLQGRLHTAPDRERRYRINEVFCFNTAWRTTIEQLMHLSDAVLLDVRGLTAEREGTGYEIRRLAGAALLPRVVAVGDDTTDWTHVDAVLRSEGQDPQRLQRLHAAADPQADALFAHLLQVAAARRLATTA